MRKTNLSLFQNSYLLIFLIFISVTLSTENCFAQDSKYQVGKPYAELSRMQGGYYDYSKPDAINMDVYVWGYVKFPGKYTVPMNTSVFEFLSLAGGPVENATFENIRLYRTSSEDDILITFSYNDIMWEGAVQEDKKQIPELKAGDAILVPGKDRYFLRDYLSMGLSIFSALISLSILIINISD